MKYNNLFCWGYHGRELINGTYLNTYVRFNTATHEILSPNNIYITYWGAADKNVLKIMKCYFIDFYLPTEKVKCRYENIILPNGNLWYTGKLQFNNIRSVIHEKYILFIANCANFINGKIILNRNGKVLLDSYVKDQLITDTKLDSYNGKLIIYGKNGKTAEIDMKTNEITYEI